MAIDYEKGMRPNLYELMQGGGGGGSYTLPPATDSTLGGIMVGEGLNVTNEGILSAEATPVDTYTKAEIDNLIEGETESRVEADTAFSEDITSLRAELNEIPRVYLSTASGSLDNIEIAANSRKASSIDLTDLPAGYHIIGYRQISLANGSSGGANVNNCSIQWFSTTGNGTKAQISIINHGSSAAKISITVTVFSMKV